MEMPKIHAFELRQRVRIPGADCEGRIVAIMDSMEGVEYRVAYWREGERKAEWVGPDELEPIAAMAR